MARCETVNNGMYRFVRDSNMPILRGGCPQFTRMAGPQSLDDLLGYNSELNDSNRNINRAEITGYIAPAEAYRTLTDKESAWLRTFRGRHHDQYAPTKGKLDYMRNYTLEGDGKGVLPYYQNYEGRRLVYLYTTTRGDLQEKFTSMSAGTLPSVYIFDLFKPSYVIDAINVHVVAGSSQINYHDIIVENFDYLFNKGVNGRYLGPLMPPDCQRTYLPEVTDLVAGDFLVFTHVIDDVFAAFWATSNFSVETPAYWVHDVDDPMAVTLSGKITRGMAPQGSPFFMTRSSGSVDYNINNGSDDASNIATVRYNDPLNTTRVVDRSGMNITIKRTWH
jgi:hypothetical protein